MAQFTADVAGMLEIFAIAAGLVLLHRARKEAPAKLLNVAGWVLIAGGIIVGVCTTFYWFRYQSHGAFDALHVSHPGMIPAPARGIGPGTTGPAMGSMPHAMTPAPTPADQAR